MSPRIGNCLRHQQKKPDQIKESLYLKCSVTEAPVNDAREIGSDEKLARHSQLMRDRCHLVIIFFILLYFLHLFNSAMLKHLRSFSNAVE